MTYKILLVKSSITNTAVMHNFEVCLTNLTCAESVLKWLVFHGNKMMMMIRSTKRSPCEITLPLPYVVSTE
jgi:hypothetical protein